MRLAGRWSRRFGLTMARARHQRSVRRAMATLLLVGTSLCTVGCPFALFDHGEEWRDGPFSLEWVDLESELALNYESGALGGTRVIDPSIFAVGADRRYIVAKRHPLGADYRIDATITDYLIVDRDRYDWRQEGVGVLGPLTENVFGVQAKELKLPDFSTECSSKFLRQMCRRVQ